MTLYSTIWCRERPGFTDDVTVLNRRILGTAGVWKALRRTQRGDAVVVNGALGARQFWIDLWFAIYVRWMRRGVGILVSDATWHPRTVPTESRAKWLFAGYAFVQKRLLLLCESAQTHYCFLSNDEVENFIDETGTPRARVHFTPFSSQLPLEIVDELLELARTSNEAGDVFAGGNSLRDYDTLIIAASRMDARFVIASSNRHVFDPRNVSFTYLGHHDFFRAMARSAVVVVPLIPTRKRSVGQQTYLNALALGKLTIVSDVSGVRDHLTAGRDALVVPPRDPDALEAALRWALAEDNRAVAQAIALSGQRFAATMTFAHYCERLSWLLRAVQRALPPPLE